MAGSNVFVGATREMLDEILREAESYLQSQLTSGIAADQRAMAFLGAVSGAAALLITGGVAVLLTASKDEPLGFLALVVACGLLASAFMANLTARPVTFWYPGNSPSAWVDDVANGIQLHEALAAQASHYVEQIDDNRRVLDENASTMRHAMWMAWAWLLIGAVGAAGYLSLR